MRICGYANGRTYLATGGHFSSKSRRYSVTLTELSQARTDYAAGERDDGPEPDSNRETITTGQWKYIGSGLLHRERFWAAQVRDSIQAARIRRQLTDSDNEQRAG
jgi:hypothetical protein